MKYSRLSTYKIKKIIVCFCEDLPATKTARILSINRNTINSYYNDFRRKIFKYLIKNNNKNTKSLGEFEFDAKRKKICAIALHYLLIAAKPSKRGQNLCEAPRTPGG